VNASENEIGLNEFWKRLANASERILILDYDGTLAPFRADRDKAEPYPGVRKILNRILKNKLCRLIMVTGRSVDDLLPLLKLEETPEIWGAHGMERLYPDGRLEVAEIGPECLKGLEQAWKWAEENNLAHRCECKHGSVAFHWRGLEVEELERAAGAVRKAWSPIARRAGLKLHDFDGGVELRYPGRNKGDAVNTVLGEVKSGDYAAAYLGDDLTDEDAFRAIKGRGLAVLVREDSRPTLAGVHLTPPDELLAFLNKWVQVCGGKT